jgi:hypothetical protein
MQNLISNSANKYLLVIIWTTLNGFAKASQQRGQVQGDLSQSEILQLAVVDYEHVVIAWRTASTAPLSVGRCLSRKIDRVVKVV